MKKTIKSLIVGLVLTTVANGQKSLNLRDIEMLFENAIQAEAGKIFNSVGELQLKYADALRKYRVQLVATRDAKNVAIIAAIDEELRNMMAVDGGNLLKLVAGSDLKMQAFRATYKRELDLIMDSGDRQAAALREVLIEQLTALKKRYTKEGNVEAAVEVHKKLAKLGSVDDEEQNLKDYAQSAEDQSVGIIKGAGAYAYAFSNEEFKMVEGKTYTFSVELIAGGEGVIDTKDEIPYLVPAGTRAWAGNDAEWAAILKTMNGRQFKISKSKFGWNKFELTFTADLTKKVRFAMSTYQNEQVYFKNFSLVETSNPTKNILNNRKLMTKNGWENSDELNFSVGVNKAGK